MAQQTALEIQPMTRPVDADVTLPGSKSYTNRALIIAAMADGESLLRQALFSDDTDYMAAALRTLGIHVEQDEAAATFHVQGAGGRIPVSNAELFCGNAGTAARFLTAFVATGNGTYVVDGVERMRQRPIQPLLESLQQLGVNAYARNNDGCPPVVVQTTGFRGGQARMRGDISSQYFSALLMASPLSEHGLELHVEGSLVHRSYIEMTASTMEEFGCSGITLEERRFIVPGGQHYTGRTYDIEPDASGASYFFAAAALTGGRVRVLHVGRNSMQGDLHFVDVLGRMGCKVTYADDYTEVIGTSQLHGVDVDMGPISDTAQTLAALAPFVDSPLTIRGIAHARAQETDRVAAMVTELRRLGMQVEEHPDGFTATPGEVHAIEINTYDDHRMAMSFAVTGLKLPGLRIKDPACVSKTFPDFWERFAALRGG